MGKSDQVLSSFPLPPSGKVIEKSLNSGYLFDSMHIQCFFFFLVGIMFSLGNTAPDRCLVRYS